MSAKIALQVLGSLASAGTVTTGLVLGAPKLKSALHSDEASVKSFDEISNVATDSKLIEQKQNNPPQ